MLRMQREHQGAVDPRQADWQRLDTAFACFCNLALPSLDCVQSYEFRMQKHANGEKKRHGVMASWLQQVHSCTVHTCAVCFCAVHSAKDHWVALHIR